MYSFYPKIQYPLIKRPLPFYSSHYPVLEARVNSALVNLCQRGLLLFWDQNGLDLDDMIKTEEKFNGEV